MRSFGSEPALSLEFNTPEMTTVQRMGGLAIFVDWVRCVLMRRGVAATKTLSSNVGIGAASNRLSGWRCSH